MTATLRLTSLALDDLGSIVKYLVSHAGMDVAGKVEAALFNAFDELCTHPSLGHRRSDLTSRPVLFYTVYSYGVIFRREPEAVVIVAVIHGARDTKAALHERGI